jgi:heterodisulfide reductase subunit A-like polyferredoxin
MSELAEIQRSLGKVEANQEALKESVNLLRTDVSEIKTNCGAMKCRVNPVVGAGVAGGGVVGLVAAALMAWLQSKGYIP